MHVLLECQVLSGGQRHLRGGDTLDSRVVCQVHEHDGTVDRAGLGEVLDEEVRFLKGDTDCGKDNGEFIVGVENLCLTGDLRGQFGVRQTGTGKDWQLLAADQGVQSVDGRDAGLDKLVWIDAGSRVHRHAVDVDALVRDDFRSAVDRAAHTGEDASQHILRNRQLQAVAQETNLTVAQVDAGRAFEQLDDGVVSVYLQHLAAAGLAAGQLDFAQLVIGDAFDAGNDHQRTCDFPYGAVFL